jgi:hypothetical protein
VSILNNENKFCPIDGQRMLQNCRGGWLNGIPAILIDSWFCPYCDLIEAVKQFNPERYNKMIQEYDKLKEEYERNNS